MSFNFPNLPVKGQVYAPSGGPVYQWNELTLSWNVVEDLAELGINLADAWWPTRNDLVQTLISGYQIYEGKTYTAGGYQYLGKIGSTVIPDLPGLEPFGDAFPEQWKDNTTPLATSMADAVQAGAIWSMANNRKFVARGRYKIEHPLVTPYTGHLNFDFTGAFFYCDNSAAAFSSLETDFWLISGTGPDGSNNSFWFQGGSFDCRELPGGALPPAGGHDVFGISTAESVEVVHMHVEKIYTGEDYRDAGGDSHIGINCSRADVFIGLSQGAVDLGVYHTSSPNTTSKRHEFVKVRGNFKGCQRAGKSTRGSTILDIEISCADCAQGWVASAIDVGTVGAPAYWSERTGHVKVIATRCGTPVLGSRSVGITYDITSTDNGLYLPARDGLPEYVGSASRNDFRGITECSGTLAYYGINPEVSSRGYGGGTISNFGAVDIKMSDAGGGDIVQSQRNFFIIHCYGGGRIVLERDGTTDNHYYIRADINTCILLGTSSLIRQGHPTYMQDVNIAEITGTAVTQNQKDETAGRLLKVGDFGLGAYINIGSTTDLDNVAPGLYTNTSSLNVPINVPVGGPNCWGIVSIGGPFSGSGRVIQIASLITNANAVYYRRCDGAWSPWVRLYPIDPIQHEKIVFQATSTSEASVNFPSGNAPSAPVNGDMWLGTGGSLQIRINGVTKTFAFV